MTLIVGQAKFKICGFLQALTGFGAHITFTLCYHYKDYVLQKCSPIKTKSDIKGRIFCFINRYWIKKTVKYPIWEIVLADKYTHNWVQ